MAFSMLLVSCADKDDQIASTPLASETEAAQTFNGKIVFIQMDSIQVKYGKFIDLNADFQKKQTQAQSELQSRAKKLQSEVTDFQQKVQSGQMTEYQARIRQEELQKKNAEFENYSNKIANDLAQEQMVISNQLSQELEDFLVEFNSERHYSMILQSTGRMPVALADPSLDITNDIIAELNKRYEAELASKSK